MSDKTEDRPDDGAYVSFAIAWRLPTGELVVPGVDSPEEGSVIEGGPVIVVEAPPAVAYELGWAIGLYANTLLEVSEDEADGDKADTKARATVMKRVSDHFRETTATALAIVHEDWALPYDYTSRPESGPDETPEDKA